jgi:hypothetical protein
MIGTPRKLPASKDRRLAIHLQKKRADEAMAACQEAARELVARLEIQPELADSEMHPLAPGNAREAHINTRRRRIGRTGTQKGRQSWIRPKNAPTRAANARRRKIASTAAPSVKARPKRRTLCATAATPAVASPQLYKQDADGCFVGQVSDLPHSGFSAGLVPVPFEAAFNHNPGTA